MHAIPEELSPLSNTSARSDVLSYVSILLNMLDSRDWARFKLVAL
jgi:hypothetical protein